MHGTQKLFALITTLAFLANLSLAQDPIKQNKKQNITPTAASNSVVGSGTPGQITKWAGISGSTTFVVGDSNIFEDKFGKVGIGTQTPTSLLTVQGMIETTLGGYKFPDGTVQTTAGIASVTHDASLMGDGRSATPLGIALGGVQTIHLANGAVTAPKIANGAVVRSLNGLFDNVSLVAGANITITPSGNTLTIAAANVLTGVAHDATLQGNGSGASPLGVAVPLSLSGSVATAVISATNSTGDGVFGQGGNSSGSGFTAVAGAGVKSVGGNSSGGALGGNGVRAEGGSSNINFGGSGVSALGGDSNFGGGDGVTAGGGFSDTGTGGAGVSATGGPSNTRGGAGVFTEGGSAGHNGGDGLFAKGGQSITIGFAGGDGIFGVGGSGLNGATVGLAARFLGDVLVLGNFSASGTKMFKIDHPLDPENLYLKHAAIESSEVLNLYSGNITTDQNGDATIGLPDWFEALNKDFRYQLTVIGQFAQAIVSEEIKDNRFAIKTSSPSVRVSWQVSGVRSDAVMKKYPFKAEEAKSERERGYYLTPEVFNQPEEKSIEWARHPELMQKLKQQRVEAEAKIKNQQQ